MITRDNCDIGRATRFGTDWSGKRCGAKTRAGGICPKPAYKDSGRCHNHGGAYLYPGPRTKEGRQRVSEAHLKHGHFTKDKKLPEHQLLLETCKVRVFQTQLISKNRMSINKVNPVAIYLIYASIGFRRSAKWKFTSLTSQMGSIKHLSDADL